MMRAKILVTGAAGGIGQFTVAHLVNAGYRVRAIDQKRAEQLPPGVAERLQGAEYRHVDLLDLEKLTQACDGIDFIVHLAGIPQLFLDKTAQIFQVNVGGSFNLYTAAATKGIQRIAAASSINFLGNGFGRALIEIPYLPIDESMPGFTTDAYAFSKEMVESVAAYFWRSAGISSICFRFPVVYTPLWMSAAKVDAILQKAAADFAQITTLPPKAQKEEIDRLKARYLALRWQRSAGEIGYDELFAFYDSEPGAMLLREFDNFWAVITVWDAVLAIEATIRADWLGVHPLYVAEPENCLGLPTQGLVDLLYPGVKMVDGPLVGRAGLLNTSRAKNLLNFRSTRSQRSL